MSFYHNVFAREHNAIVDEFRRDGRGHPDADSGLRNPGPGRAGSPATGTISDDELFQVGAADRRRRDRQDPHASSGPRSSSTTSRCSTAA